MRNTQATMNLTALGILGAMGLALVFHAVPMGNEVPLAAIIGGVTGVLVGAANADQIKHVFTPGTPAAAPLPPPVPPAD